MHAFVIALLVMLMFPSKSFASNNPPSYLVFINQVRGTECCDVGSVENYTTQITEFDRQNLTSTFALRYDTLNNPEFVAVSNEAKQRHQLGGLLEITPMLAIDANVSYGGNSDNWFKSKYAFLVGYSQTDRKKLIDTYMSKFKSVFNEYPKITAAWMIDSYSLEYLSTNYQVTVHEITREQWGVDSYTLYGGSPHYPYYRLRYSHLVEK